MKRVTVQFRIEASIEIEVPESANFDEIDRLAKSAVEKEAGVFATDLAGYEPVLADDGEE